MNYHFRLSKIKKRIKEKLERVYERSRIKVLKINGRWKEILIGVKRQYPQEFINIRATLIKNGKCFDCGSILNLMVHHLDKDIYNNDLNNLRVLCWGCHCEYHDHMNKDNIPYFLLNAFRKQNDKRLNA